MSGTFARIVELVARGDARATDHALERLEKYQISLAEIVTDFASSELLEDYPDYHAGPNVLLLHSSPARVPIHSVWGIRKGTSGPAMLVTAYVPDSRRWSADFRRRKP